MDLQASEVQLCWREPQEGEKLKYRLSQDGRAKSEDSNRLTGENH